MNRRGRLIAVITLLAGIANTLGTAAPPAPVVLEPDDLVWETRPTGVQVAVLQGDPQAKGPFTLRLRYPAGYRKGPHSHPGDAYVTVLEGSYFRAYGTVFDESAGIPLKPGTFSVNPAGVNHYEWTVEPAMLQVTAMGPWTTVYVNAEGVPLDPSSPESGH